MQRRLGLSDAAGSRKRDETMIAHKGVELVELTLRPTKLVSAIGKFAEVLVSGHGPTVTEALFRPPSKSERAAATSNSSPLPVAQRQRAG